MNKVLRKLGAVYYAFFVLALGAACGMIYLVHKDMLTFVDPQSAVGQAVQYVVILYVIASVPGALYGFKRMLDKRVKLIEDSAEKLAAYGKYGVIRIALIGAGAPLAIVAFYLLGTYQSMLWCAGISLIALFFCKPTEGRIQQELDFQL